MAPAIPVKSGGGRESVRALTRGLAILRFVNAAGDPRPSEIAVGLDRPRPTVYRLLQTLEEAGYVALSPTGNRVRVTRLAAHLGDGFAMTSRICQAAGAIFAAYAPKIMWPLDISVYENAAMVIQETTHGRSPLSIDRGMTGLPVADAAHRRRPRLSRPLRGGRARPHPRSGAPTRRPGRRAVPGAAHTRQDARRRSAPGRACDSAGRRVPRQDRKHRRVPDRVGPLPVPSRSSGPARR